MSQEFGVNHRPDDKPQPANANIALRAYELYCVAGCQDGRDLEHWLQAESELRQQLPEAKSIATEGTAK